MENLSPGSLAAVGHAPPVVGTSSHEGAKRKRIGRACDFCNRRAIKCVPTDEGRCQSCINFGVDKCTYDRPAKKRGPPKASEGGAAPRSISTSRPSPSSSSSSIITGTSKPHPGPSVASSRGSGSSNSNSTNGLFFPLNEIAPVDTILQLLDIFHSAVYPIFPYIHYPRFASRIRDKEHTRSRAFYASAMALCALTTARIRDKAVFSEQIQNLPEKLPPSDAFFTSASAALPKNLVDEHEFDYMRAAGLLALTALQNGQPAVMRQYFSRVHALTSIMNLDDESRWVPALSYIESEERRRVFWSIYQMDVYACVVWGGTVRVKESQVSVAYPTEVDDEYISDTEPYVTPQPEGTTSWVKGWNRVTDMYRVLEYSLDRFRAAQLANQPSPTLVFRKNVPWATVDEIYEQLDSIYHSLPPIFKDFHPKTAEEDIFLFQSTNVIVSWHTAKMVAIGADDLDVPKRCQVINELLAALSGVPPAYFACMSCPLLFHLVGIVQVLANIITGPLSPIIFRQVRTAMVRMADILQAIEGRLSFTAGASQRLRDQVARLDRFMETSSLSDMFAKTGPTNYFNPVDLMAVPNMRSFDVPTSAAPAAVASSTSTTGASPADSIVVSGSQQSPGTTLASLWPPVPSTAPTSSADDLSAITDPALAPLNQANQPTFQLPDNVLAPFAGDFTANIFPQIPQWYSFPTPRSWFTVDEFAS